MNNDAGNPRLTIRRDRLLQHFRASDSATILLVAPAGYGKTTVVRQWIDEVGGVRLGLSQADLDVEVLVKHVGTALASILGCDARRIEDAFTIGPVAEKLRAIGADIVANEQARVRPWLAIDDYHQVRANTRAEQIIQALEESRLVTLMIASRGRPHWATARRFVHLEIEEVNQGGLAFDAEEVNALIPDEADHVLLLEQAKGWPAAISLIAHALKCGIAMTPEMLSEAMCDYFAEELYDDASLEVQTLLLRLTLIDYKLEETLTYGFADMATINEALSTGLVELLDKGLSVHPLGRRFLSSKLENLISCPDWIDDDLRIAMASQRWIAAFEIIRQFDLDEHLEHLIGIAIDDLVKDGRFATLEQFLIYGETRGCISPALRQLAGAELALSRGDFAKAFTSGQLAAAQLADGSDLKPRSFIVAGEAARLMHRSEEALLLHTLASDISVSDRDTKVSTWGRYLATISTEERGGILVHELESLSREYPEDRLRLLTARCTSARLGDGFRDFNVDEDAVQQLLRDARDLWVRTSWRNMYGYILVLRAQYRKAVGVLLAAHEEIRDAGLRFARSHIEWSLAAADLGLRNFGRCDARLRKIERLIVVEPDLHLELNVRVLRARLLLTQGNAPGALSFVEEEFRDFPSRAMHGEYLATRALVYAVSADDRDKTLEIAARALSLTKAVETQMMVAVVHVLLAEDEGTRDETGRHLLDIASHLDVWDFVICAARAERSLLPRLAAHPAHREELKAKLEEANDCRLARRSGIEFGVSPTGGVLSPREVEVLDLISLGMRNKEIATALFIEASTVKSHVERILTKLKCKTRAEAVARYAESINGRVDVS